MTNSTERKIAPIPLITQQIILNQLTYSRPLVYAIQGTAYRLTDYELFSLECLTNDKYWDFVGMYLLNICEAEGF